MALDNLTPVRPTTEALIISSPTGKKLVVTCFSRALRLGDVIQDGPNAGWIYCDGKGVGPFLVEPQDSGVMRWRKAIAYAAFVNAALPSKKQLDAMHEARTTGALNGTFNVTGSNPAGWYWSATEYDQELAMGQRFSDGKPYYIYKNDHSSVRLVRSYSIA